MASLTGAFDTSANPASSGLEQRSDASRLTDCEESDGRLQVRSSIVIQADPESVYLLWRDVESAPIWQDQVVSVTVRNATLSHWVMKSGDSSIEWDVDMLADEPGRRIAWASVAGDLHHAGEVFFEEAGDPTQTLVTVFQEFRMGDLARTWQAIAGRDPRQTVIENLRDFKALAETGSIGRSGSTSGSGDSRAA